MTKKLVFLTLFITVVHLCIAQPKHIPSYQNRSQVEFVSNGDRFWLYLNDRQYNNHPEKLVTINNIDPSEIYQVRIVMDNQRKEEFTESIAIHSEEAIVRFTIARDRNPHSSYTLWLNEQIIHAERGFYTDVWQELVIQLHSDIKRMPAPNYGHGHNNQHDYGNQQGHGQNPNNNPPTSPAQPTPPAPMQEGGTTISQNTTVVIVNEQTPPPAPVVVVAEPPVPLNCPEQEFLAILATIDSQTFDSDKLKIAKQAIPGKAMTAAQLAKIAKSFTFENDRLDFLKFAYNTCFDPENYYQTYNSLEFSSSKEELIKYIK